MEITFNGRISGVPQEAVIRLLDDAILINNENLAKTCYLESLETSAINKSNPARVILSDRITICLENAELAQYFLTAYNYFYHTATKKLVSLNFDSYISTFSKEALINISNFINPSIELELNKKADSYLPILMTFGEVINSQLDLIKLNKTTENSPAIQACQLIEELKYSKNNVTVEDSKSKVKVNNQLFEEFVKCFQFLEKILINVESIKDANILRNKAISNMISNLQLNVHQAEEAANYNFKININESTSILAQLLTKTQFKSKEDMQVEASKQMNYKKTVESSKAKAGDSLKSFKSKLKSIFQSRSLQLYTCIRCRCILRFNERSKSNCTQFSLYHKYESSFESNDDVIKSDFGGCTEISYFYCYNCKLNPCSNCVYPFKNNKCGSGHLIFRTDIVMRHCSGCYKNIDKEGFSCSICNISICFDCYNDKCKPSRYICSKCKFDLSFGIPIFAQCTKCLLDRFCHWSCFFCNNYCCVLCIPGVIEASNGTLDFSIAKTTNGGSPLHFCGNYHKIESFTKSRSLKSRYEKQTSKNNYHDLHATVIDELNFKKSDSKSVHCTLCYIDEELSSLSSCSKCQIYLCESCLNLNSLQN